MQPKTPEHYLELYQKLHAGEEGVIIDGKEYAPSKNMFDGDNFQKRLLPAFKMIMRKREGAFRVLDYGCGKAEQLWKPVFEGGLTLYQLFPGRIQQYYCYDPGNRTYQRRPSKDSKFDIAICADVMEHVPHSHVFSTLATIASHLEDDGVALFSISARKAKKHFLDGENLHCTVMPMATWVKELDAAFKDKAYYLTCDEDGVQKQWYNAAFRSIKNANL